MYALETLVAAELTAALGAGWAVLSNARDAGDRRAAPAAVVSFLGASVGDGNGAGVQVVPQLSVQLIVRRGASADLIDAIDAATQKTIAALHGWAPGAAGGRRWARLNLRQIDVPDFADDGLVGCRLVFSSAGTYAGNPNAI